MEVFYISPWVPREWITAHGLEPRGIWFARDFALESTALAAGVCSFANTVVRLAEKQRDSAVIFTTRCDQLRRGFDSLAGLAASRAFLFNLPATWQTPAARRIFAAELERLGDFLVGLGGRRPTLEHLVQNVADSGRARAQLLDAAASFSARHYAEAIARFHWDGSSSARPLLRPAPRCRGRESAPSESSVPLAIVGGPLPRSQWHLLDAIEDAGGRIVLNATEPGERSLYSPGAPGWNGSRPELARAEAVAMLARAVIAGCADVFQRPNTPLYEWLGPRLASRAVRGIVLWHFVGCDLWRAEVLSLREAFRLPILLLEAGETASDAPRTTGRIQAFLESLK